MLHMNKYKEDMFMDDIDFYTVDEVSEILGLSNQTIRKLIRNGQLYAIRLGRVYRIPKSSLAQLKSR